MTVHNSSYRMFNVCILLLLSACSSSKTDGNKSDFSVVKPYATALTEKGIPSDVAEFFAAAKITSHCVDEFNCTVNYLYPNGATREVKISAKPNQVYTPTNAEIERAAQVADPVFNSKMTTTGLNDFGISENVTIDFSYFLPTSSITKEKATNTSVGGGLQDSHPSRLLREPSASEGSSIFWSEIGAKGSDVAIGSLLDHFKDLGKSVEVAGSIYAIASALSDVAGAAIISKEVNAWLKELDELEKCASDPTNPITQTEPGYIEKTVSNIRAIRTELKINTAVRFLNLMSETASQLNPVTTVMSIPMKQVGAQTEKGLKELSEQLMKEARSSVVSCKPTCPTNLSAKGVSESQIDITWNGSIGNNIVTGYRVNRGGANIGSTQATAWSDTGLTRSTLYCYTVNAYNDYGDAENCPEACGRTLGPPVVISTTPYSDEKNVPIDTKVTATFSETMDENTISNTTFILLNAGSPVGGSVSYNGQVATFSPTQNLEKGKKYTAKITTGVKDADGEPMEKEFTWTFTTIPGDPKGNVEFTVSGLLGVRVESGAANISWTLFETQSDYRIYTASGTISGDIIPQVSGATCAPVPVASEVLPTYLVVYNEKDILYPNSYHFNLAPVDPNTMYKTTCTYNNGSTFQYSVAKSALVITVGAACFSKSNAPPIPYTDATHLSGTYSCEWSGTDVSWDFIVP